MTTLAENPLQAIIEYVQSFYDVRRDATVDRSGSIVNGDGYFSRFNSAAGWAVAVRDDKRHLLWLLPFGSALARRFGCTSRLCPSKSPPKNPPQKPSLRVWRHPTAQERFSSPKTKRTCFSFWREYSYGAGTKC